jgi:hypothetical protein
MSDIVAYIPATLEGTIVGVVLVALGLIIIYFYMKGGRKNDGYS